MALNLEIRLVSVQRSLSWFRCSPYQRHGNPGWCAKRFRSDTGGYDKLREFLHANGVRHVLLAGYATDMCYARTCAGYENLSKDFNVFLVGDATLATFPAHVTPRFATSAHIAFASLNQLVTQISWIKYEPRKK